MPLQKYCANLSKEQSKTENCRNGWKYSVLLKKEAY